MAKGRKPKWEKNGHEKGVTTYTLSSWKYFHDAIKELFPDNKNYVFRGQRSENWKLEPTLNRHFNRISEKNYDEKTKEHLENFKSSIRGRADFIKDIINDENELWAIGQHNFLSTPLLDFTFSPYVAAYFAFYEKEKETDYRAMYAVSQFHIEQQINSHVELFKPQSGHNRRLLNQSGLFVKFNSKNHLEKIVLDFITDNPDDAKYSKIYKIRIPNSERETALKSLNKMNINHNSLFPDLFGSSIFCNTSLDIKSY